MMPLKYSLLIFLSTTGISSAATSSLAPNARLAKVYAVIMVAPIIIVGLMGGTRPSYTLSAMMAILMAAMIVMIKDNSHLFWSSLTTIERLRSVGVPLFFSFDLRWSQCQDTRLNAML